VVAGRVASRGLEAQNGEKNPVEKGRKIRGKDKIATAPLPTQVYKKRMRIPTNLNKRNSALRLQ